MTSDLMKFWQCWQTCHNCEKLGINFSKVRISKLTRNCVRFLTHQRDNILDFVTNRHEKFFADALTSTLIILFMWIFLLRIPKIQKMGAGCLYYILQQIYNSSDDAELQTAFNIPTKRLVIQVAVWLNFVQAVFRIRTHIVKWDPDPGPSQTSFRSMG